MPLGLLARKPFIPTRRVGPVGLALRVFEGVFGKAAVKGGRVRTGRVCPRCHGEHAAL